MVTFRAFGDGRENDLLAGDIAGVYGLPIGL
jgi:hypothetical protein